MNRQSALGYKMLELPEKDFEAGVIKMLQQAIKNSLRAKEKIENLSKEIEDTRRSKWKLYK